MRYSQSLIKSKRQHDKDAAGAREQHEKLYQCQKKVTDDNDCKTKFIQDECVSWVISVILSESQLSPGRILALLLLLLLLDSIPRDQQLDE